MGETGRPGSHGRSLTRGDRPALLVALLIGVLAAVVTLGPLLSDPWVVHDDARQVVYQARLAARSTLFAADPNAAHARLYLPAALAAVYRAVDGWIDPLTATKLWPFVLSPLLAALTYGIARATAGPAGALAASALMTAHSWSRWPPTWGAGDAGELLGVLEAGLVLALVRERRAVAAALAVAAAHLYPPAFLVLAGTLGIEAAATALGRWREDPRPPLGDLFGRSVRWAAVGVLGGGLVLGARALGPASDPEGRLFTLAEARAMVEFGERGRTPLYYASPWTQLSNGRSGLALDGPTCVLLGVTAAALLAAGRGRPAPPAPALALLAAGVGLWWAANHLVFLYQPARFVILALPLVAAVTAGPALEAALGRAPGRARGPLAAVFMIGVGGWFGPRLYASHMRAQPALMRAVGALPETSLLAGPPRLLDDVPAFAERRVVISDELVAPVFTRRYAVARDAMLDMLNAYYAADAAAVDAFCARHGVTHWILDREDFPCPDDGSDGGGGSGGGGGGGGEPRCRESEPPGYFPPFEEAIEAGWRRGFPYALLPPGDERYLLVACPLGSAPAVAIAPP